MSLKDTDVIVVHGDRVSHVCKEGIVHTWVVVVMAACSHEQGSQLLVIQSALLLEALLPEVVEGLAEISSMCFVMVHDSFIATLDGYHVVDQFLDINRVVDHEATMRDKIAHNGHKLIATGGVTELEDVEVYLVNLG